MAGVLRCLGAALVLLALPAVAACEDDAPRRLEESQSASGPQAPAGQEEGLVTVTGVVTGNGVECPVLRADDGRLYALLGDIGDVREGQRLTVTGRVAEMSFCMQGTALDVVSIERQ